MKQLPHLFLVFGVAMIMSAQGCSQPGQPVTLTNPLDAERVDQPFLFSRNQLNPSNPDLLPAVKLASGDFLASQADDLDGDGQWDELAFVCTMQPLEKVEAKIVWLSKDRYPQFSIRTNVRYGKMTSPNKVVELLEDVHYKQPLPRGIGYPYQMDGPAWENDKMGFRHYYDGRNCRDVFGKRMTEMVLDSIGIRPDGTPGDTYHVLSNWGRDIMSAANSFGLGGLALRTADTLLRMGVLVTDTIDIIDSTRFAILTEGPVRSVMQFDFYGWEVPGDTKVDVHNKVTIWAGQYGYENEVTTSPLPAGSQLVTGIVTNNNDKEQTSVAFNNLYTAMFTHDKQTYNKVWFMGMGLILPNQNLVELYDAPKEGPGIIDTWCVAMKPDAEGKYRYTVYAVWELQDERFRERAPFENLILQYGNQLASPPQVEGL